ncbi:bifunctional diguanylate cyclase/phosphodiesterase [Jiella endophytica]|uniref:Bifunctional diguanylate cyclase/phosphodiesterase n=1 Tax=Jiella endophytica TaxID=2558362 RepID=A0A4Y8RQ24_9HYPH|nr:bifunctional diguanylate cyclase/phosphodiesterase [Jiella endophytica]TFF25150.1 bifunctional diguanylate cyclase/phosphodiesterase [Jiella endophytica]
MTSSGSGQSRGARWFVAALLAATAALAFLAMETSVQTDNYHRGLLDASSYNATFDYARAQLETERLARSIEGYAAGRATQAQIATDFDILRTRLDTLPVTITGRPFRDAVAARDDLSQACDEIEAMLPTIADPASAGHAVARLDEVARSISRLATVANAVQGDIVAGWRQRLSDSLADLGLHLRLLCGIGLLLVVVLIQQKLHFRRRALTDPLTGLPNRASFRQWPQRAVGANEIAVAIVDVDLFKEINDSCGHQSGDRLLIGLGAIFRGAVGRRDKVARIGGDEFALMFTGRGALERASEAAALVTRRFGQQDLGLADDRRPTLSVGIAASNGERQLEALLIDADSAMYAAKKAGGACIVTASEDFRRDLEFRRRLQRDILHASQRNEFDLAFQPIVDVGELRAHSFEALLRWQHPELGRIPPDLFIPLAEESGAIIEIGRFVLDRALSIAANWPAQLTVSVNVSALQLSEKSFVRMVRETLKRNGVPASRLILEITETALIKNANAGKILDDLRRLGVGIALDDFGTGYASMGYLQQYRFDKIKIDKSFVSTMNEEGKSAAIVRAICALAKEISATVVAEGIETEELLSLVGAAGCDFGQGYLFARPMSALQTALFIEKNGWGGVATPRRPAGEMAELTVVPEAWPMPGPAKAPGPRLKSVS